jgi:bile acid:Na+ symporter, BASS family
MGQIIKLFRNRNFLLILSIGLGLFMGEGALWTEPMIIPVLAVVMTLSILAIPADLFRSSRTFLFPILIGLVINYGLLGGLIFLLNALLIHDSALQTGFIIVLAVPPAVAIIPFTFLLKGDTSFSLMATIGCYLGALILMPLITIGYLGPGFVNRQKMIMIMIELIGVPLLFSRLLKWREFSRKIEPYKGSIINWGFFLVTYTIVGLNRSIFLNNPSAIFPVASVALAGTFLMGFGIEKVGRGLGMNRGRLISLVLLGTQKNTGLAAGLALTLFNERTALPATVYTIIMIIHFIWLNIRQGLWMRAGDHIKDQPR